MRFRLVTTLIIPAILLLTGSGGCREKGTPGPSPSSAGGGAVHAFVAASTQGAVREIAARFAAAGDGEVRITAGGSNMLAGQIRGGAPADLFLSADERRADEVQSGEPEARRRLLLGNDLVIVTPADNPSAVSTPQDLIAPRVKHVALAGENVPAGTYARQSLASLGIYDPLLATGKVLRGEDVTHALTWVARGEADAGIVYATDARGSERVRVVYTFPPGTHAKIVYPLLLLKAGQANPAAVRFYDYLASGESAEIFRRYGFNRPGTAD